MSRTPDPTIKIALLRAAEEVFSEKGLPLSKVEEITRRAGTSKGAFYLHFDSKEEAFKQVVESFLARCSAMLPLLRGEEYPTDPVETILFWRDSDEQMYEFLWQNRAIVRILLGCQGEFTYLTEAFVREIHARTAEWIARSKRLGLFREDVDTELSATVMGGAHNELSRVMFLGSSARPPIGEWVRNVQALFVRGMGSPELIAALDEIESTTTATRSIERTKPVAPAAPAARRRTKKAS
jgi:AcrR family transcriptional regulator